MVRAARCQPSPGLDLEEARHVHDPAAVLREARDPHPVRAARRLPRRHRPRERAVVGRLRQAHRRHARAREVVEQHAQAHRRVGRERRPGDGVGRAGGERLAGHRRGDLDRGQRHVEDLDRGAAPEDGAVGGGGDLGVAGVVGAEVGGQEEAAGAVVGPVGEGDEVGPSLAQDAEVDGGAGGCGVEGGGVPAEGERVADAVAVEALGLGEGDGEGGVLGDERGREAEGGGVFDEGDLGAAAAARVSGAAVGADARRHQEAARAVVRAVCHDDDGRLPGADERDLDAVVGRDLRVERGPAHVDRVAVHEVVAAERAGDGEHGRLREGRARHLVGAAVRDARAGVAVHVVGRLGEARRAERRVPDAARGEVEVAAEDVLEAGHERGAVVLVGRRRLERGEVRVAVDERPGRRGEHVVVHRVGVRVVGDRRAAADVEQDVAQDLRRAAGGAAVERRRARAGAEHHDRVVGHEQRRRRAVVQV